MITYEMFDILMTEYEHRHNYWSNELAHYGEACMGRVFDADLALTNLQAAFPEYHAQRKLNYVVQAEDNHLDIAF